MARIPEYRGFDNVNVREGRRKLPQSGWRSVRHIGGRLCEDSTARALVAIPTLPNETLSRLNLQFFAATDSDIQVDSPQSYEAHLVWTPFNWMGPAGSTTITSSTMDNVITNAITQGTIPPYGADANPGGDEPEVVYGSEGVEFIWNDDRILASSSGPGMAYNGVSVTKENHAIDRWSYSMKKRRYFEQPGIIIFGVYVHATPAQTDFGVAEMDASAITPATFNDIFVTRDFSSLSAQEQKIYEVVYGGDTYIEADTWKDQNIRSHVKAQALFKTPYPHQGN